MKVIIDCDEEELEINDVFLEKGFIQIAIRPRDGSSSRFATVSIEELTNAIKAFV